MKKYNLLVAQSGGPTAAINATLAGVIDASVKSEKIDTVYGAINGIEGIFNDNIIKLNNIDTALLSQTPAAYLGSCRNKLPDFETSLEKYIYIFDYLKKKNIRYFLYIGGNDSMDTVCKMSLYAKKNNIDVNVIGIPKTIDNDLDITDHTPGFGSAAKYIATTVAEITKDSQVYDLKSVTIIEIMGRNAGWLTAAAALARTKNENAPHLIYLPEVDFSLDKFIEDINNIFEKGIKNIIIAVSEGIRDKDGKFICEITGNNGVDVFGHNMLSGAGKFLENYVKEKIGCKVRSVELNVCQRCAGHLLSKTDISESKLIGKKGVVCATSGEKGKTGRMMTFKRVSSEPYKIKIEDADITNIANVEKKVPLKWIKNGNDITKDLVIYLKPLIAGEMKIKYENGIPSTLYRKF